MATVDVGIGHEDDAVVADFVGVEFGADAGAQCRDEGGDLLAGDELVEPGFFNVEHFAAQRQDGLKLAVAALLGGASSGVSLDDEDLAFGGVFFLAVGEFAGQAYAI